VLYPRLVNFTGIAQAGGCLEGGSLTATEPVNTFSGNEKGGSNENTVHPRRRRGARRCAIANTGTAAVNGWRLVWSFANGQVLNQAWGGTYAQSGAAVTVTNASYTANIPPGGSVTVGFLSSWNGTNAAPASFALNGQTGSRRCSSGNGQTGS
jgi:hypothetical protein